MPSTIPWYSIDRDLHVEDHDPVDVPGALAIVDRYFGQLRFDYTTGEEAIAATVFGFARAPNDFLELGLVTPSEVSLRVELPRPKGGSFFSWLRGGFQFEEVLTSRSEVAQRVEQYFALSPEQFQTQLGK